MINTAKFLLTSLIRHSSLIACNRLNSDSTENAVQPSWITSKSRGKQNGNKNFTSQVNPS
jgi:phage-related tail protein